VVLTVVSDLVMMTIDFLTKEFQEIQTNPLKNPSNPSTTRNYEASRRF
jgi:hypothetical protein